MLDPIDTGKRVYVLDTSAILFGFTLIEGIQVTCREVIEEVKFGGAAPYRAELMKNEAGAKIIEPSEKYVEIVRKKMSEVGEVGLSEADIKLLAIALEFKDKNFHPVIVSADYSIQNMALIFNVNVEKIIHRGVTRKIKWISYCPSCKWVGGVFKGGRCPRCGARLKRRPTSLSSK
ncbi:MAG: NOB1 family endonuclease [Thaumarchaeota archaeon]|nr:NOB1 family endonuclease [Candidatus Geocrenenecus arthurdayi]MCL7391064.1 NOB1 family endonuclease [Candidatus Geocrenenecus arthurdayi]MCL7403440.1 NOB1 family endonuclease [Candidatus Geocrenenecus arthurdayi]